MKIDGYSILTNGSRVGLIRNLTYLVFVLTHCGLMASYGVVAEQTTSHYLNHRWPALRAYICVTWWNVVVTRYDIIGVKKTTQNDFVYGLLGRHPLQIDRYWLKIMSEAKPLYMHQNYEPISIVPITGQARLKNCYMKMDIGMCGKIKVYMIQTHLCMYSDSD